MHESSLLHKILFASQNKNLNGTEGDAIFIELAKRIQGLRVNNPQMAELADKIPELLSVSNTASKIDSYKIVFLFK